MHARCPQAVLDAVSAAVVSEFPGIRKLLDLLLEHILKPYVNGLSGEVIMQAFDELPAHHIAWYNDRLFAAGVLAFEGQNTDSTV